MFQFTGLLLHNYVFIMQYLRITISVFPHSEISGSKLTYSSPKHIVVRHVLHQLLVPRHSPCALSNLITIFVIYPNLMRYFNVQHPRKCWTTTLSSFQRTISERTISQNRAKYFLLARYVLVLIFLHRKEVIHPHVPVGIPCYDFTPVADPAFAGPLLKG